MTIAAAGQLIDRFLPDYDVRTRHETTVDAPAAETFAAMRSVDLGRSLPVTALLAIRSIPRLLTGRTDLQRRLTIDSFASAGFVILGEEPCRELAIGAVGRFWRPDSGIEPIDPEDFEDFVEPGYAKAVLNITVEERGSLQTLLATETRVLCTDEGARRRFRIYWTAIGPFSGFIRRVMLQQAKAAAEAAPVVEERRPRSGAR